MNTQTAPVQKRGDLEIGRRVHMLMWDRQIKQTTLAPMLGIEQSALSKKLRGQRGWSVDELITLADVLHTSVAYLFGEVDETGNLIRDEPFVHPLGLEPRTHCFSDDHVAEVVSIDSARSFRLPMMGGGEAA